MSLRQAAERALEALEWRFSGTAKAAEELRQAITDYDYQIRGWIGEVTGEVSDTQIGALNTQNRYKELLSIIEDYLGHVPDHEEAKEILENFFKGVYTYRYSTNWMGPINLTWIKENGDQWAAGRIDIRGGPEKFGDEYGLRPMHKEDWVSFGDWLDTLETPYKWPYYRLIDEYEQHHSPIRWWKNPEEFKDEAT
jgi:hypothetical protein